MKTLVTFSVDVEVLEDFKKNNLGKKFSHVIEDFMKLQNEEKLKEKNLNAPDNGALRLSKTTYNNAESDISILASQEMALDLLKMQQNNMEQIVYGIDDWGLLGRAKNNAGQFYRIADKRIHVNKEHIRKVQRTKTITQIPLSKYSSEKTIIK